MTSFCRFSIKMAYFWKLDSIKTTFEPSYKRKPHWIFSGNSVKLFSILKRRQFDVWRHFDVILGRKWRHCVDFQLKWHTSFERMTSLWPKKWRYVLDFQLNTENSFTVQKIGKIIPGGSPWMNLTKKVIKGIRFAKICVFGYVPYIS